MQLEDLVDIERKRNNTVMARVILARPIEWLEEHGYKTNNDDDILDVTSFAVDLEIPIEWAHGNDRLRGSFSVGTIMVRNEDGGYDCFIDLKNL